MDFSSVQESAIDKFNAWFDDYTNQQQVFRLFGYAGSGKTTLAKHLAASCGITHFAAFTGKAAYVLQTKGCPATTIHSLIYQPKDKSQAGLLDLEAKYLAMVEKLQKENKDPDLDEECIKLRFALNQARKEHAKPFFQLNMESPLRGADLCVIDEVSMVDSVIGRDLESFGCKILCLGDPAQLPPIFGAGYFTNCEPDVMIKEIHRQAQGNPIIDLATIVRKEGDLKYGTYGESSVVPWANLDPEFCMGFDQILVGKNVTRHAINKRIRTLKGRSDWVPVPGDRLVCLKNDHERGLLNGAIWICVDVAEYDEKSVSMVIRDENSPVEQTVHALSAHFSGDEVPWQLKRGYDEFAYGYALTVHKSQGSQWNSVLVFDESAVFREDRFKWLYTGITRAAERVTVVKAS